MTHLENRNIALNKKGYTLIELMVAMVLSTVVLGAIISTYQSQQKSYVVEDQVAGVQQNIRVGLFYFERDFRMAGCDPLNSSGAGIETADSGTIQFTMDITGGENDGKDNDKDGTIDNPDESAYSDGDTDDADETVTYALGDSDGDGDTDLERNGIIIALNIDVMDIVYLDSDGNVLAAPVANPDNIRSIQLTIVARTDKLDHEYTDSTSYSNQQATEILPAQNDHYRRRVLTTFIKGRNLGI